MGDVPRADSTPGLTCNETGRSRVARTSAILTNRETGRENRLFSDCPDLHLSVFADFDRHDVRPAADGAIFDVFLPRASSYVERHDDLLAAPVAQIASFVAHRSARRLQLWRQPQAG